MLHSLFNVALIELPAPIHSTDNIQPIAMPTKCVDTDVGGLRVFAAGVGQTYLAEDLDDLDGLLRHATFTTYARSEHGINNFSRFTRLEWYRRW